MSFDRDLKGASARIGRIQCLGSKPREGGGVGKLFAARVKGK